MRGLLPYAALTALGCVLTTMAVTAKQSPIPSYTHGASSSRTYNDHENGVSFRYPSSWKLSKEASFYMRPSISADRTPQAIVTFDPQGTPYETTVFDGVEFVYVVVPHSSLEACTKLITANTTPDAKPDCTVVINKIPFLRLSDVEVGMCHHNGYKIYQAFRNGRCYLFETDFYTFCENTADDRRAMSDPEATTLERQLDSVLQSIKIKEAK